MLSFALIAARKMILGRKKGYPVEAETEDVPAHLKKVWHKKKQWFTKKQTRR